MSITVTNLTVSRDGLIALKGIDLAVDSGKFLVVVGPNGSGKTTLLRSIAGDLTPADGHISVNGVSIRDLTAAEAARQRAFLGQDHATAVGFDVATVVAFGAFVSDGVAEPQMRVQRAMERTGITDLASRRHDQLSGGEQRRVGIARVLCQDAPVLLLDEPTDSLDLGHATAVMAIAREEALGGKTVVASSHDLNIAARYADRVALLDEGEVVAIGSPADVLTADRVSSVYRTPVTVVPHPTSGTPMIVATD